MYQFYENIKGIDYAKAFAVMQVLILHLYLPSSYDEKVLLRLWIAVAVPIFMIITGHNYILSYYKSKENWLDRDNLSKKLKRIIIPYIYILILEIILVFIKSDFVSYDFSKYKYKVTTLFNIYSRWNWTRKLLSSCPYSNSSYLFPATFSF